MDHHAQILAAWREKSKYFTFNSDDNRLALMKYVLKFADISNPARPKASTILFDTLGCNIYIIGTDSS